MTTIKTLACLFVAASTLIASEVRRLPAFPGAEGFGAHAKGGRGGRVIAVTSLADSGPGTLREACEAEGPRTVVFRVGGTISLQTPIAIVHPYITIAGQTASGDGILIRKGNANLAPAPLQISTHDVIIRFIRIRSGDSPGGRESDCLDISNVAPGDKVSDIIIDHCSFSWSTDENLAIMGRYLKRGYTAPGKRPDMVADNWDNETQTTNITVQWCIISEGLLTPQIGKSRAALIKFVGSLSYHHNLMAHFSAARNPRLQGHEGTVKDVVNNVIYNVGRYGTGPSDGVLFNYVGNYMKSGPDSDLATTYCIGNYGNPPDFKVYVKDNYHSERRTSDDLDDALVIEPDLRVQTVVGTAFSTPPVRTTSAAQAFEEVLRYAGCTVPRRDSVDERIITEVRTGAGRIRASVAEAGGYPEIPGGIPFPDSDGDGMPDNWEIRHGLDPDDSVDGNQDRNGDGYTNLEEYLNSLVPFPR